jgi:protein SCO1/2
VLTLAAYAALAWGAGTSQAGRLDDFGDAPAFGLTDHLERPARSDDFRGKVVVANFVYTSCQDTCPLLSLRMQALQEALRREGLLGSRVQLLSFTVDPARDTPAVLRAYAERHQADPDAWRFLTGPAQYVQAVVVQGFRLGVQPAPAPNTSQNGYVDGQAEPSTSDVMHSNRFVLIDRRWRIRAYYDGLELDLGRAVGDVRLLLRHGA